MSAAASVGGQRVFSECVMEESLEMNLVSSKVVFPGVSFFSSTLTQIVRLSECKC